MLVRNLRVAPWDEVQPKVAACRVVSLEDQLTNEVDIAEECSCEDDWYVRDVEEFDRELASVASISRIGDRYLYSQSVQIDDDQEY